MTTCADIYFCRRTKEAAMFPNVNKTFDHDFVTALSTRHTLVFIVSEVPSSFILVVVDNCCFSFLRFILKICWGIVG